MEKDKNQGKTGSGWREQRKKMLMTVFLRFSLTAL